jgi:Matrixin
MVASETRSGAVFHEAYFDSRGHEITAIDALLAGGNTPTRVVPKEPVCSDSENPTSQKWVSGELPVRWFTVTQNNIDTDPVPSYLDAPLTLTNERNAHTEWTANQNNCGVPDNTTFSTSYQGNSNGCSICFTKDGVNRLMWGNADNPCSTSAVGCTQTYFDFQTGSIIEADTMLDTDAAGSSNPTPWTNGLVSGRYDIWSVVAHETGHVAGFNHVSDQWNVMWATAEKDNIDKRSLGKGDAKENNAKY